jgi:hypothetical protein
MSLTPETPLPPFCTLGPDLLPVGPPAGSRESEALAAWEVLTGARVARSQESGRMSLLAAYRAEAGDLDVERVIRIALHPFEGAQERWACRRARKQAMTDAEVCAAIVQEMGGPATGPDEMTELGFWSERIGFHFDSREPAIYIYEQKAPAAPGTARFRRRRIDKARLIGAARRLHGLTVASCTGRTCPTPEDPSTTLPPAFNGQSRQAGDPEQLSLL